MSYILVAISLPVGVVLGFLISNIISRSKLKTIELEISSLYKSNIAVLEEKLRNERSFAEEKLKNLIQTKEELTKEFENISNRIFEEKGLKIAEQNKEKISNIVNPLKDEIEKFRIKITSDGASLKTELNMLKELNSTLSTDAKNLTNALKGSTKSQGAWGELILERALEYSGLRKGIEYEVQTSSRDDDGRIKRPDAIVHLPDNKDVIIDSKVSLISYEQYVSSTEGELKTAALNSFKLSISNHIKNLNTKEYSDLPGIKTIDHVLMFIPIEGALLLAIENDSQLISNALQKKIILVSPTTLILALKIINTIWRYEYQNRNSEQIAEEAGKIYNKLYDFTESFLSIENAIKSAQNHFHDALNHLSQGNGNLFSRSEKLKKLGVKSKTNKDLNALPQKLSSKEVIDHAITLDCDDEPQETNI